MWSKEDFEKNGIYILGEHYNKYKGLYKGESPDYYNDLIGIEITRAISTESGEMDAFWRNNHDQSFSSLSSKQLKKLGFKDCPLAVDSSETIFMQKSECNGTLYYFKASDASDMVLAGYIGVVKTDESSSDVIQSSVSSKLKKLNDHYRIKDENSLLILIHEQTDFLYCKDEIISIMMDEIIISIKKEYNNDYCRYFDKIFLVFIDVLLAIDTNSWEYKETKISQRQIDSFKTQDL